MDQLEYTKIVINRLKEGIKACECMNCYFNKECLYESGKLKKACDPTCDCIDCHGLRSCPYGRYDGNIDDIIKDCECGVMVACDQCFNWFSKLLPTGYCDTCWRPTSNKCNGGCCDDLPVIEWHYCSKECKTKFEG